jgi:hypothetical protein
MPMTTRTWFDDELPMSGALRQAGALFLAGLARKGTLLASAAVFTGALAGAVVWMKYSYAPEYTLRIVEPDRAPTGQPSPPRQLADYVQKTVFTSEPLLAVMGRHDLYPSLARRNPRAALESFREDIDVSVHENYFLEERPVGAAPRSALVSVSYRSADPELAVDVTRELGELIVQRTQGMRENEAKRAADLAEERVRAARNALAVRRSELASMQAELDRGGKDAPEHRIAYIGLLGSLPALESKQDERERREASLALEAALERRGVGTRFEVVDDAQLPQDVGAKSQRALAASATFVLGFPLLAIAIGAFAPKRAVT